MVRDVVLNTASRHLFACLGLGSASAALCLGLTSVSNLVPRLSLVIFGSASAHSRSFCLDLARRKELVTFQGFVVHLVHLANKFSVIVVVSDIHYYCTIYWFYFSSTFFLVFLFFMPQSPFTLPQPRGCCLCLDLVLSHFQLSLPWTWQFCLSPGLCLEKMPGLHHGLNSRWCSR